MVRSAIVIMVLLLSARTWAVFGVGDVVSAPNLEGMFAAKWAEEAAQWAEKVEQWQTTSSRWIQRASHMQQEVRTWQRRSQEFTQSDAYRDIWQFGSNTNQLTAISRTIAADTLAVQEKREQLHAMSEQFLRLQSNTNKYRQTRSACRTWLQSIQDIQSDPAVEKKRIACTRITNGMDPVAWKNHFAGLGDAMVDQATRFVQVSKRIQQIRESIRQQLSTGSGTEKDLQVVTNTLLITLQEAQELSSQKLMSIQLRTEEMLHGLLVHGQRNDSERLNANHRIDQSLQNIFRHGNEDSTWQHP